MQNTCKDEYVGTAAREPDHAWRPSGLYCLHLLVTRCRVDAPWSCRREPHPSAVTNERRESARKLQVRPQKVAVRGYRCRAGT